MGISNFIDNNSIIARNLAQKYNIPGYGVNDGVDAIRHSLTSANVTRSTHSSMLAATLGNMWEAPGVWSGDPEELKSNCMDLFNNNYGRMIGEQALAGNWTEDQVNQAIVDGYFSGNLITSLDQVTKAEHNWYDGLTGEGMTCEFELDSEVKAITPEDSNNFRINNLNNQIATDLEVDNALSQDLDIDFSLGGGGASTSNLDLSGDSLIAAPKFDYTFKPSDFNSSNTTFSLATDFSSGSSSSNIGLDLDYSFKPSEFSLAASSENTWGFNDK